MNARTDTLPLAEPDVDLVPVDAIAPSQTHIQQLRRKRFNQDAITELAASMLKAGQLQAIVLRPHPKGSPQFEIVLGERRWLAAKLAGLKLIEAKTKKLDDAQVLEVQLIENLQREELQPLEEAAGYEELMKVGKLKPEDLGEKVGKSRSWVYSRLNLMKLSGPARDALQSGRLDVSRAMVVASVASEQQRAEALALALERNGDDKPVYSVRELRHKIVEKQFCLPLVGAPFDIADAKLVPEAGACADCRFRTGNCDPEALDPDVCTNLPCFTTKAKTAAAIKRKTILSGGGKVLKGEEARMISPSVKTIYGHVDLDLVCQHDNFPEAAPKEPAGCPEDEHGERADTAYLLWREREKLWQPRTYRALLAGQKFGTVVIDDPKTKQLRELVPFKEAAKLLKPLGINLPSWANNERPKHPRNVGGTSAGAAEKKKDPAKEAAEQAKRELEAKIELAIAKRLLKAVKDKHDGKLSVGEWAWCARGCTDDIDDPVADTLWKLFGQKNPGWQSEKALEKLGSKDLPAFLSMGLVAQGLSSQGRDEKLATAILGRFKIDRKKIEAEVRKVLTPAPKPTVQAGKAAWPFPTGARAPSAAATKNGRKSKPTTKGKKK